MAHFISEWPIIGDEVNSLADQWNLGSSYVIEREIGSGGMGNVWLGHDHEGARYAVKVLREELARDSEVLRRFVRERSVLLGLDHPGLVRVHDLVVEKNTLAIVMDYVDGPDLRHFLAERGTLAPARAALLVQKIAESLDAVHSAGIVHRDLKPENILVEHPQGEPNPRLADFGIATIAVEGVQLSTAIIGTPHYMAPELFDGNSPTPAVDVYSLGIILFELLCGIQPYRGTPVQLIAQHATSRPGRPAGIPDPLWQAIDEMTSIEASARPTAGTIAKRMTTLAGSLTEFPALAKLSAPPSPVRVGGVQQATSVSIWSNPTVPVSRHDVPAQSQPRVESSAPQSRVNGATPVPSHPNMPRTAPPHSNAATPTQPGHSMPAAFSGSAGARGAQRFPSNQGSATPQQFGANRGMMTPQQFAANQRVSTPQQFTVQRSPQQSPPTGTTPWKAIIAGVCAVVLIAIGVWGIQNALANKSENGGGTVSTDPSIIGGGGTSTPPTPTPTPGPSTSPTTNVATPVSFDEPVRSELNDNGMWYGTITITEPTTTLFFVSTYGDADLWLSVFRDDFYWSNENRDDVFATFTTNRTDPALVARLDPGEYQVQINGVGYTDSSFMLETFVATDIATGPTDLEGLGLEDDEGWRAHFLSVDIPTAGEWDFDVVTTDGDVKMGVYGIKTRSSSASDGSPSGAGTEKDPNIVTSLDAETTLVIVQEESFQPFDATLTVTAL